MDIKEQKYETVFMLEMTFPSLVTTLGNRFLCISDDDDDHQNDVVISATLFSSEFSYFPLLLFCLFARMTDLNRP